MRKQILIIALACGITSSFGQTKTGAPASNNCFKEWYAIFKERGADPIPNGANDVIISIRNGDYSDCFMGKVDVSGGMLAGNLMIQKVDGTYAEFDKKVSSAYQGTDGRLKEDARGVSNGMSASVALSDGEMIRLFFFKTLKDKPKGNKRAPSPSSLIK